MGEGGEGRAEACEGAGVLIVEHECWVQRVQLGAADAREERWCPGTQIVARVDKSYGEEFEVGEERVAEEGAKFLEGNAYALRLLRLRLACHWDEADTEDGVWDGDVAHSRCIEVQSGPCGGRDLLSVLETLYDIVSVLCT